MSYSLPFLSFLSLSLIFSFLFFFFTVCDASTSGDTAKHPPREKTRHQAIRKVAHARTSPVSLVTNAHETRSLRKGSPTAGRKGHGPRERAVNQACTHPSNQRTSTNATAPTQLTRELKSSTEKKTKNI